MHLLRWLGRCTKPAGFYVLAALLSLALVTWVLRLWEADLAVPFHYQGDSMMTQAWIKGMIDNGWYLDNPYLGAPLGQDMRDFPLADSLHLACMKAISLVFPDMAITFNIYFLLTFPLTTLTALFAMRQFDVSRPVALLCSLLFAFLPYHFIRVMHLFLASYYMVPPAIMLCLWIHGGQVGFLPPWVGIRTCLRSWCTPRSLGSLVVGLLIGAAGLYYAAFACFLLLVAGVAAAVQRRILTPLLTATAVVGVIGLSLAGNFLPNLAYIAGHGKNPYVLHRGAAAAEIYGLKITQLLFPVAGHRLPFLANFKTRYNTQFTPLINENDTATLGLFGSMGFLMLIGWLFHRRTRQAPESLGNGLACLNAAALLLATIGGFGAVFSYLASPLIRGYNRISVYIAFLSLFAVALLLDRLARRSVQSRRAVVLFLSLIAALATVGILDQTTAAFAPAYTDLAREYREDAEFVHALESELPEGALIFQLPYLPFPEHGSMAGLTDYEQLRGYLHSSRLRWSYGAMKGREGDRLLRGLAVKPVDNLVAALDFLGFQGIYLARSAYLDQGARIEADLAKCLGTPPRVHGAGQIVFYNLSDYHQRHRQGLTDAQWRDQSDTARHPMEPDWLPGGWYRLEPSGDSINLTSPGWGKLELYNPLERARKCNVQILCKANEGGSPHLTIEGDICQAELILDRRDQALTRTLVIPPGRHVLSFRCCHTGAAPSGFVVTNFTLAELD